jgi:hypothetical protein
MLKSLILNHAPNFLGSYRKQTMTQIFKAHVYQDDRCFIGEIEGINIKTNVVELQNTPIEFYADSKQELLAEMVKFLKGTGKTGILRVVNQSAFPLKNLSMDELCELEDKAESVYRALKLEYHAAFNNGVDIGYDAVTAANLRLNAIRNQIHEIDYESQRVARIDAIERNRLMLDDA